MGDKALYNSIIHKLLHRRRVFGNHVGSPPIRLPVRSITKLFIGGSIRPSNCLKVHKLLFIGGYFGVTVSVRQSVCS